MKPLQKDCCIFRELCNNFFHRRLLKSISGSNIPLVVILFYVFIGFHNTFSIGTHSGRLHTDCEDRVLE